MGAVTGINTHVPASACCRVRTDWGGSVADAQEAGHALVDADVGLVCRIAEVDNFYRHRRLGRYDYLLRKYSEDCEEEMFEIHW
jgi:hypothetical protein